MTPPEAIQPNWICPDLRPHWQLAQLPGTETRILVATDQSQAFRLSPAEELALLHFFAGRYTVAEIQRNCRRKLGDRTPPDLVVTLIHRLMASGVLEPLDPQDIATVPPLDPYPLRPPAAPSPKRGQLRDGLEWILHADGYWILRNPETVTYLQVAPEDKPLILALGHKPPAVLAQEYGHSPEEVQSIVLALARASMLVGIEPPPPPAKKFNPMQLLYIKKHLWNPDQWLERHIEPLRWIWQRSTFLVILTLLSFTVVYGLAHYGDVVTYGRNILAAYGWTLFLPFVLITLAIASIHELAHAFTLKHYGGQVVDMGIVLMCLFPAAYTDTTDSYALPRRRQAVLVVAAGILFQVILGAIAFWLWRWTTPGSWLNLTSFLTIIAALFNVLFNLNPLARFDGYYLASALTGINNPRERAFALYGQIFRRQPILESGLDFWLLLLYAPLNLAYVVLIFFRLLLWLGGWILTHIPYLAAALLALWLVYYLTPNQPTSSS